MRFSGWAGITLRTGDDWFDPVLTEDTPLYIDPFLVFEDGEPLFADSHDLVVRFFEICRALVRQDAGRQGSTYWKKALRLLTFPEPKEFALGLAMGSPNGSGTSEYFSEQMAEALELICRGGKRGLDYVETLAIFVPGLGVNRISDIFCNILKERFILYTQKVCEHHGVQCEMVNVRNAKWDEATSRWSDKRLKLPRKPGYKRRRLADTR